MESRTYYGKIILFGEYSMIFGGDALLVPCKSFGAKWATMDDGNSKAKSSNAALKDFLKYLLNQDLAVILDLAQFATDIADGLYFQSDIPSGYGLGSSGALVAAVYDRYRRYEITNPMTLKNLFAKMENCFHSSSSGNDPLQCYYGKPFAINEKGMSFIEEDQLADNIDIFLIDSKIKSNTKPLVSYFKEQRNSVEYLKKFNEVYVPCVSSCISSLMNGNRELFFNNLKKLSLLQVEMLKPMITENMRPLFAAQEEQPFTIKISGSGGGGYFLGFTTEKEKTVSYLAARGFSFSWI